MIMVHGKLAFLFDLEVVLLTVSKMLLHEGEIPIGFN